MEHAIEHLVLGALQQRRADGHHRIAFGLVPLAAHLLVAAAGVAAAMVETGSKRQAQIEKLETGEALLGGNAS